MRPSREVRSLVIARWRPHLPDGGAALRNSQNITGLGALGPVDVLSIGRPEEAASPSGVRRWQHFEVLSERRLPGAWLVKPHGHPRIDAFLHPDALTFLKTSLAKRSYDLIVIEEIIGTGYLPLLKAMGATVVFDNHNVEAPLGFVVDQNRDGQPTKLSPGALRRRFRLWMHGRRMEAVERRAVRMANMVWACSCLDAAELVRLYAPCAPVRVVPNAVDVETLAPAKLARAHPRHDAPIEIVYVGSYSYYPNEEAALRLGREILPLLRASGATCRLNLVGRDPTAAIRALATSDHDVTVTGDVESIVPYLSRATMMVVPITIGSGTRFKILEAFATGCPVVSTTKGAEGIQAEDGDHLLLRDTPEAISEAILSLQSDPEKAISMAEAAFTLVRERYSWKAAARDIAGNVAELLS